MLITHEPDVAAASQRTVRIRDGLVDIVTAGAA
jgi:predicted ABC-type transport system involved in lysophospholipase L1 biosynthesis ATPase subunit